MFAQAPEFLSGQDIEIEYVSPLAKAQKSTELQSIMRAIEIWDHLLMLLQYLIMLTLIICKTSS